MPATPRSVAICLICFASVALADDFKTISGKEYKNATVSRVEPDGIVLTTHSGISKVYFAELPKEIQERFHYNAAQSAQFTADAQAAQESFNAEVVQEQQEQKRALDQRVAAAAQEQQRQIQQEQVAARQAQIGAQRQTPRSSGQQVTAHSPQKTSRTATRKRNRNSEDWLHDVREGQRAALYNQRENIDSALYSPRTIPLSNGERERLQSERQSVESQLNSINR